MCKRLHFALLLLMFAPLIRAQETPKVDVFAGYSYVNVDTNGLTSRLNANGWDASVSGNLNHWFAVEGDFGGYYWTYQSVDFHDYSFLGGPRVNFGPAFVHALIGADHGSALGFSQDSFAGAFGGGVQIPVAPRWAVRASADYALTRHNIFKLIDPTLPNYTQNNFRVSAGIVFSFGGTHETSARISGTPKRAPSGTEQASLFGVTGYDRGDGFLVSALSDFSPAAAAGIRPGDVIMTIDAQPVHSARDIESAIATSQTRTVRVMYFKSGVLQTEVNVKVR